MNSLKLEKNTNSVLKNIKLKEQVNKDALNQLLNSDLLLKDSWSQNGVTYDNERNQLLAYKALYKKNKYATITYKLTSSGYARVYAAKSLSLGSLRKEIRHTLSKKIYADIDVENCHPMLLSQVCKKNDIDCEHLLRYTKKRESILEEVVDKYKVTRDDAKGLFIALMYGGQFEHWVSEKKLKSSTIKTNEIYQRFCT